MQAVLLQDMRTRFGGSYYGYLIALAWPLAHMGFITLLYLARVQVAPVGDSPAMFIVTGAIPYIICLYPARLMARAISQNRQLLNIPVIKPIHLIVSRSVLETLNAIVVMFLFILPIYLFDIDVVPQDLGVAQQAVFAALFLGIGLGVLNVVLCAIFGPYFLMFFNLSMIGMYALAGVYIPVWALPEVIREYAYYNPLLNLVEWMRSAYYTSYDNEETNKALVIWVGAISLTLGLLGERFLRGKFFT